MAARLGTRSRRAAPAGALAAAACLVAGPGRANDTEVTLGAGGLVPSRSSTVVMEAETLSLSLRRVDIVYVFRNHGPRDVEATVAFPLPALDGGDLFNEPMALPRPDRENFVGFAVAADGKPVTVRSEVRAVLAGKDVTARLRAAGLGPDVFPAAFARSVAALDPARRRALEAEGLIEGGEGAGGDGFPLWAMKVQYYWTQRFPAGQAVTLTQSYSPVVGGGYITYGDPASDLMRRTCASPSAAATLRAGAAKGPGRGDGQIAWRERNLRYILTTARNWNGPIGRFSMTVTTDHSDDLLLTCFPGLRRLGPTRWGLTRTAYRPPRDLDLDILQPERPPRGDPRR